jgi:hypothetical protein
MYHVRENAYLTDDQGKLAMKSILDPSFRYTRSIDTDLKKTFARVRRELRNQQQSRAAADVERMNKVLPIRRSQH